MKKLALAAIITAVLAPAAAFAADGGTACYDLYQPVCTAQQVECFAAPCYPVYKTYSNSCFAGLENATILHEGECTAAETGPIKPATTTPPVHVGSTTPVTSTSTATSSAATTTPAAPQAHSFLYRFWHVIISWFTH